MRGLKRGCDGTGLCLWAAHTAACGEQSRGQLGGCYGSPDKMVSSAGDGGGTLEGRGATDSRAGLQVQLTGSAVADGTGG